MMKNKHKKIICFKKRIFSFWKIPRARLSQVRNVFKSYYFFVCGEKWRGLSSTSFNENGVTLKSKPEINNGYFRNSRLVETGAGFTLVELLVAISILSLSILATFTAVSNNIKGQNFAEDQVVAYYLADEGIESIRNIRDNNAIANVAALGAGTAQVSWLNGIDNKCANNACVVDAPLNTVTVCSGNIYTCPVLNMNTTSGLYGYTSGGSWVATQFTRSIYISPVGGSHTTETIVNVVVMWTTNGVSKTYTLSENIKPWQ